MHAAFLFVAPAMTANDKKMSGYHQDVLDDPNYNCDETIEPEPEIKPAYGSQQWAETYSDDIGESPDW